MVAGMNERTPATARVLLIRRRVVGRIGQGSIEANLAPGGLPHGHEAIGIRPGTAAWPARPYHLVDRVHGQFELGIAALNDPLPLLARGTAATDTIATAVATSQARGIESGVAHPAPPPQLPADGGAEQTPRPGQAQQTLASLLQRGKVGNVAQTDRPPQVPIIAEQRRDAAIVGLDAGLEDQTNEQLRLGVQLGAELMASARSTCVATVKATRATGSGDLLRVLIRQEMRRETPRIRELFYEASCESN